MLDTMISGVYSQEVNKINTLGHTNLSVGTKSDKNDCMFCSYFRNATKTMTSAYSERKIQIRTFLRRLCVSTSSTGSATF